jgi:hypothetical protein
MQAITGFQQEHQTSQWEARIAHAFIKAQAIDFVIGYTNRK